MRPGGDHEHEPADRRPARRAARRVVQPDRWRSRPPPRWPGPIRSSPGCRRWRLAIRRRARRGPASYVLTVTDPAQAAPAVTRALVAAGADVLSIGEPRHSLEDVYLELVDGRRGPDADEQRARRASARSSARSSRSSGATGSSSSRRPSCRSSSSSVPRRSILAIKASAAEHRAGQAGRLFAVLAAADPGLRARAAERVLGGRGARAGHARAGADHAGRPRGAPHRQGRGDLHTRDRRLPT